MDSPPPWDVGEPQPAVRALVEAGGFGGRVLDVGCGYGENALLIAASGLHVTGVDRDDEGLRRAAQLSRERSLDGRTRFIRFDVRNLAELGEVFDTVLDSLVFHAFKGPACKQYVAGLRSVLRPGGRLHVLGYSDLHVGPPNPPHQVSRADLHEAFADGWTVDEIRETRCLSNLAPDGVTAWLASYTRNQTRNQEES
ncbi:class I SAM-dependent methyltransferase [Catenulispora sp. NL8]|uniref:Class I SAM-dependent methyltransferase n=1 Tax=Catenulispora pinistramenti TaxID=2705254 RepID=A0ABS5KMG8_9ACTN|nr:class I SAM-dependent methyltransferase [Catenulispora pinistramenti]MBS2547214.1 class I SAM-dependent methyltransferase [Catenulispora pinistramenti]